ncbi:hypothetical protein CS060_02705 [Anoxybacillus flavithermus]|uniref:NTP pyrophosphohydrolase MazG-like domain-containing protein n=1 Tax=Anoxybacillus flavithermus TaxID=33934 RepID=A0A2G5RTC6_9BACL|nr:hypothetical protein CS060_02705 [Anoxybacillus flavithermus]
MARLSEEVGEVAEEIRGNGEDGNLIKELSDVFIISTCLANQYCVNLDEEFANMGYCSNTNKLYDSIPECCDITESFLNVSVQLSKISRILNHYEGDKVRKKGESASRVSTEIAKLHVLLVSISKSLKGDLFEEVDQVLQKSLSRDKGRFGYFQDPTTSLTIQRFKKVAEKTSCIFSSRSKIWGSYSFIESMSLEENLEKNLKLLERFNRVAPFEGLDGFVIEAYGKGYGDTLENLSYTLKRVLKYLSDNDPAKAHCMNQNILKPDWRFSFGDQTFFITTFAPCYPEKHPRYSYNPFSTFIFLQPEFSFDHHGIHSGNAKRESIKEIIRKKFRENGSEYNIDLVRQPLEAYKYVKPINVDDAPVKWWEKEVVQSNVNM